MEACLSGYLVIISKTYIFHPLKMYLCTNKAMQKINIAIDGYSGCGKSSTAKNVAAKLGYKFIDSGAMYRAVTHYFQTNDVDLKSKSEVKKALEQIEIDFLFNKDTLKYETLLNEQNVEDVIRSMKVSKGVSQVATIKEVRIAMVEQQQLMGKDKGVVMDGRDIGSVVFPDAELKIFMKADQKVRAKRRQKELKIKGEDVPLESILHNFEARDRIDTTREESPLVQVADAVVIDTSHMAFDEQVQKVLNLAKKKMGREL